MRAYGVVLGLALGTGCGEVPVKPDGATGCTTAADCTDPAAPYCVDMLCVAACAVNADCTDADHPICASDVACVACVDSADCGSDAPICDATTRECRGCTKDSECSGGVCVEAEGTCVADADVAFVTMMGTDTGTCTRAAPCASIDYAAGQAGAPRVIHVLAGTLRIGTLRLTGDHVLDGEDTSLILGDGQPLTIAEPASFIVEGFRLAAPSNMLPAIDVTGSQAKATLWDLTITGPGDGPLITGRVGSDVTLRHSHLGSLTMTYSGQISCENGKLLADQNTFENAYISPATGTCETIVTRNRFESNFDGSVQQTGGHLTMENNLIIHNDGYNDSIAVGALGAGSVIRFNTIVNTTAVPSDGAALGFDSSVNATSNIIAYNSGHPIVGQGCSPRYTVFDDVSTTSAGTGNQVVGIDTIFVDRAAGDYHLATDSVARGGAEPGLTMVKIDFEGNPRPNPMGSTADCGAFEAP